MNFQVLNDKMLGPVMFASAVIPMVLLARLRVISSLATSSVSKFPPGGVRAKRLPEKITFGVNGEENRGKNPMNPPRVRIDYYNWLRDESRRNEEVLSHLRAENEYCAQQTQHLLPLQEQIYNKMISHLKETDEDVPYDHGPYSYYSRTAQVRDALFINRSLCCMDMQGLSYKIHCRRRRPEGEEEVILDENELARGLEYCDVAAHELSPTHALLAYATDESGYETYTVRIKDLATGELLSDRIEGCDGVVGLSSCIMNNESLFLLL
jgi:oligopeptidase B